jgi:hypothetical protein
VDAGGDAAALATTCGTAPSLVCDGFESGSLGAWRSEIGGGNVALVADAYRGVGALRATAGAGGYAYLAVDLAPMSSGEVHVRSYVRIPAGPAIDVAEMAQLFRVGRESDGGHVHVLADSSDQPGVWPEAGIYSATTPLVRDRWLCMTLAVQLGASGGFELAFDGVPYVTQSGIPLTSGSAGFDEFSVGVVSTGSGQAQLAIDVDEVSVSRTARACD